MSQILFKDVHYLEPSFKIPVDFEGVLHLRFTDSAYNVYEGSFLICGYPQCHIIKKFRKGLILCLMPVLSSETILSPIFNHYRVCYVKSC